MLVNPAADTGVPNVFCNTITPPALCVNTIYPSLLTDALTPGTLAALTACMKAATVVPPNVTVTGEVNVVLLAVDV